MNDCVIAERLGRTRVTNVGCQQYFFDTGHKQLV